MSSKTPIPIVALGAYRHIAASTGPLFINTPYNLSAILDLKPAPPSTTSTYTAPNLAVTLRTLFPRPQVFIVGAFIDEGVVAEAGGVWEAYVEEFSARDRRVDGRVDESDREKAEAEGGSVEVVWEGIEKSVLIDMVHEPPKDADWQGHILGKLAATFGEE